MCLRRMSALTVAQTKEGQARRASHTFSSPVRGCPDEERWRRGAEGGSPGRGRPATREDARLVDLEPPGPLDAYDLITLNLNHACHFQCGVPGRADDLTAFPTVSWELLPSFRLLAPSVRWTQTRYCDAPWL